MEHTDSGSFRSQLLLWIFFEDNGLWNIVCIHLQPTDGIEQRFHFEHQPRTYLMQIY